MKTYVLLVLGLFGGINIFAQSVQLSITKIDPTCAGYTNGQATVLATGGIGDYTYNWSNGQTAQTILDLGAGTYDVTTTDSQGTTAFGSITLTEPPAVNVALIVQSALCNGQADGKVTAVATGGSGTYTYVWSLPGSPTTTSLSGLAEGTIVSVTVTDANGCTGTATDTIGAHTQVTIGVTATDVVCPDDLTGAATASAANGTAPYTYVWTLQDGTTVDGPTITGLSAGAYQVVATDANGCTSVSAANIDASDGLTAAYDIEVQNCMAGGINISFSDNSQNAVSWAWNIAWSTGSAQFSVQNPGVVIIPNGEIATVQITTTSISGCTATYSNQINTDNLGLSTSIATVNSACSGGINNGTATALAGGGTTYTYLWDNGAITPSISNLAAGDTVSVTVTDISGCKGTATAVIGANTIIEVALVGTTPSLCGNTATGTATVTSTTPGLTYTWTTATGTEIGTGSTITTFPGTYTLTANDANGCNDTLTVLIGAGTGVAVAITPLATAPCVGEAFTLSASNLNPTDAVTYQWYSSNPAITFGTPNQNSTSAISTVQGTDTIFLAVTNQNGCLDTLSYVVGVGAEGALAPAITIDLCKGKEVRFNTIIPVNGTWSFGDTNTSTVNDTTYTYAIPGTYNVSFAPSVAGCILPFDTTITVIAPACFAMGFNQDLQSCENAATFLMTSTSTACNAITDFQWSFQPQNLNSILPNPTISFPTGGTTTATLIVTDIYGCKDTISHDFPFAVVTESVVAEQSYCAGANGVQLNPDFDINYAYTWTATPTDPTLNPTAPNPTVNPTVPTTYTVVIKNGGCEVTKTITVTPNPAAQLVDPADMVVCTNAPVTLTASSSNGTIQWADNPNFNNPTNGNTYTINSPIRNGVYYVKATTADGCPSATNQVIVNNAAVAVDFENSHNLCQDGEATLTIDNQYPTDILEYEWSNGLPPTSNPTVNPASTTTYTSIINNQFGCKDTVAITVNVSQLAVTAQAMKDTICPGQTTTITATASGSGSYTYSWEPSSFVVSGVNEATATVEPTETKEFTVEVTDEFGCKAQATASVAFMELFCRQPYVFVPSAFTPDGNGDNDKFFVRGHDLKEVYFVVYDRWGEEMFQTNDPNSQGWDGTHKGQKLSPDAYGWYCRVKCPGGDTFECKGNVTLLK